MSRPGGDKGILGKDYLCVVGRLVPEAGLAVVCVDARGVPESELASRQEGDFGERLSLCCRPPCTRGWTRRSLLLTRGV